MGSSIHSNSYDVNFSYNNVKDFHEHIKSQNDKSQQIISPAMCLYSLEQKESSYNKNYSTTVIRLFSEEDAGITDYQLKQVEACQEVAKRVFANMLFSSETGLSVYGTIDVMALNRKFQRYFGDDFEFPVGEFLQSMNEVYATTNKYLHNDNLKREFRAYCDDSGETIHLLFNEVQKGFEECHHKIYQKHIRHILSKKSHVNRDFEPFNAWRKDERNNYPYTDLNLILPHAEDPEATVAFPVHRMILAQQSRYFDTLFTGGFMESSLVEIQLPEVDPTAFSVFLDLIYRDFSFIENASIEELEVLLDLSIMLECRSVQKKLLKEVMGRSTVITSIDLFMKIIETSNGIYKQDLKSDCEYLLSRLCYLGNARKLLDFANVHNLKVLASVCHYHLNITSDDIEELLFEADQGNVEAQKRLIDYYSEKGDFTTYDRLMAILDGNVEEPPILDVLRKFGEHDDFYSDVVEVDTEITRPRRLDESCRNIPLPPRGCDGYRGLSLSDEE